MITIIELPTFLKAVKKLLSEDDKRRLYASLVKNPTKGDVIQGGSGIRKIRFALGGKGKSGGCRVIYYYHASESEILMITAYAKNSQEDLTQEQKKSIRDLIKKLKEK